MNAMAAERSDAAGADEPWPLPAGWAWASLEEAAELNPATTLDHLSDETEIPFIPMAAVSEESGVINVSQRRPVSDVRKGYVRFRDGDVIFAKITPCMENGKTAPVIGVDGGYAAGSTEFHVLRPRCVEARYLWYWIVRRAFRGDAEHNMSGSAGQLRVPLEYLRTRQIPIAPITEQRRIVARIDELFAEIAEGEAALERARSGLDTWRRALLKAAVTGELTSDWREANKPNETGADLLDRVRSGEATRKSARRRKVGNGIENFASNQLPIIPETWAWSHLREIGDIVGGVTVDKKRLPDDPVDVPYLRVANVQRGFLDLKEVKTIRVERDVAKRLLLQPNDILLNEGGDRDKIGRGWIWQQQMPNCIHQNHVFRVRLHDPGLNPFLVSHYANEMARRFFVEKGKQTTNLASISMSKIGELPVPVPPAEEAEMIVDRINQHLATAEDDRHDVDEASTLASALRQSILKSAFEGRLVPQDENDEPASELLARLRSEAPAPRRTRGGKTAS